MCNWMYLKYQVCHGVFGAYRNVLPSLPYFPSSTFLSTTAFLIQKNPLLLLVKMPQVSGIMSSNDMITGLSCTFPCEVCSPQWAFSQLFDGLYVKAVKMKSRPWYVRIVAFIFFSKTQGIKYILYYSSVHRYTLYILADSMHTCILITETMFQNDT